MANKRHTPEQVINKLREAEVAISAGGTVAEASRRIGVTEQTFYRWRKDRSGKASEATRVGERPSQESGCRPDPGQPDPQRGS